ncbi:MAG: DNA (cytosine-5-)-methyltransferase [Bacteroidales bacterium]|jgi:DNA (cytosine-5)-methyltransferase 1|nr:DNA (cytosine-5-)-methyltransferase [Bacteroidales bacterium]
MEQKMYKAVSLFCGCGGADLGLHGDFTYNEQYYDKLPFEIIYATDIDAKAVATYKKNFNGVVVVCDDIKAIKNETIPACDILVGGFPCQSFSTVNPTKNPFDDRAQLYKEMVNVAKAKQPKIVIAENVKGFKTLHGGSIFNTVVSAFEKIGYKVSHSLINASDYGVPQKRERVIIIAVRKDLQGDFEFPQKTTENNKVPLSVAVPKIDIEDEKYYFSKRAVLGLKKAKNNMKRGLAQKLDEPCLTVTSHLAKTSLNSRDPVLLVDPEKELYRRFTPREAARIQSFPDTFEFAGSEFDSYKQIGNAIPPVMFWHIAKSISDFLSNETKK